MPIRTQEADLVKCVFVEPHRVEVMSGVYQRASATGNIRRNKCQCRFFETVAMQANGDSPVCDRRIEVCSNIVNYEFNETEASIEIQRFLNVFGRYAEFQEACVDASSPIAAR